MCAAQPRYVWDLRGDTEPTERASTHDCCIKACLPEPPPYYSQRRPTARGAAAGGRSGSGGVGQTPSGPGGPRRRLERTRGGGPLRAKRGVRKLMGLSMLPFLRIWCGPSLTPLQVRNHNLVVQICRRLCPCDTISAATDGSQGMPTRSSKDRPAHSSGGSSFIVRLNVGGERFTTRLSTLQAVSDSVNISIELLYICCACIPD